MNAPSREVAPVAAAVAMPQNGAHLAALAGFAQALASAPVVADVLHELARQLTGALGLAGAGVTVTQGDRLLVVAAPDGAIADLERVQSVRQAGPGVDALARGLPIGVDDIDTVESARRWPEYAALAAKSGIHAVTGMPMIARGSAVGAVTLYNRTPRTFTVDDHRVAQVMIDVATGCWVYAMRLDEQTRTTEQLKKALETRLVIEQAKGVLAATERISVEEAFGLLRKHARDHNAALHDVASAVVQLGLRP